MSGINWSDHILNFVAVILGVSLAFYISSNSERNKERDEYSQMIRSLIEELETDIGIYTDYQIGANRDQSETIMEVVEMLTNNQSDSLLEKFQGCMSFTNYSPRNVTFNSISSTGKLDLIESYDLRKQISTYHEVWVAEAEFQGNMQVDFYRESLQSWIIKNGDFLNPDLDVLRDKELVNMLIIYKSQIDGKLRKYERLVEEAKALKTKLEELIEE